MSFSKLVEKLREKSNNLKFVSFFKIHIFVKYLKINLLNFFIITEILLVLLDILDRKVSLLLGNIKKETNEENKKKVIKKVKKEKNKVKKEESIDLDVLFVLKVDRRVRKATIDDLKLVELSIKKKVEELKEKLVIKILIKKVRDLYNEILSLLAKIKIAKFSQITFGKRRYERIITFNYLILLANEGKVTLEQTKLFDDILIKRNE